MQINVNKKQKNIENQIQDNITNRVRELVIDFYFSENKLLFYYNNNYGYLSIFKINNLKYESEIPINSIKFNNLDNKIANILETTNFQKFKKTELKDGFVEAQAERQFFKSGTKNQWKNKLNKIQIQKIEGEFKKTMDKFNYK